MNDAAGLKKANEAVAFINTTRVRMIWGYGLVLLLVLLARQLRVMGNKGEVKLHFADGRVISREAGPSVLDLSALNDIPHANLCRGRGRCGTCRIEIIESDCAIKPATDIELATLTRLSAPENVRLACQLHPGPGSLHLKRLVSPDIQPVDLIQQQAEHEVDGKESKISGEMGNDTVNSPTNP